MNKSKTQEHRGLETVSEAKALSCKVPSMRPRRGIVGNQMWKWLVHAARNQSGRTWEGDSRAKKVPTQAQVVPEGPWHSVSLAHRQGWEGSGYGHQ